ncbi:MAG: tRNA pseudouridine(38-40) synthase TruA [Planctomycetes bacterium]|nr:tRNA pseudouridine(38-40) synthase TruA [Planctomycetota bacterium]
MRGVVRVPSTVHSYLLTIAYDGAGFAGWQRQEGFDSVQERLEDALGNLVGEAVVVHGAGRTDAGVHALGQCAHIRLPRAFACEELLRAINGHLPETVRVHGCRRVSADFHARFAAIGKRYVYRCIVSRVLPVFGRGRFHWIRRAVDLDAMRSAARALVGEHDFAAYSSNPGYERKRGTVRRVDQLRLVRRAHGFDLFVQGNGFLYNMVRTIAGTLIEVGVGRRAPDEPGRILVSADRRRAGENAAAEGLYLLRVLYPESAFRGVDGDVVSRRQLDRDLCRCSSEVVEAP